MLHDCYGNPAISVRNDNTVIGSFCNPVTIIGETTLIILVGFVVNYIQDIIITAALIVLAIFITD